MIHPYLFAGLETRVQRRFTPYEKDAKIEAIKRYFFIRKIGESNTYKYPTKFTKYEDDLTSKNRNTGLVQCRTLVAYILRFEYEMRLMEIGRHLGNRDHSTVVNMLNCINDQKGQKHWSRILNDLGLEIK